MSAALEIAGLAHAFGGRPVLAGVDLAVPAGRVVGLVGPNGAGKTTLMRAAATLLDFHGGAVRVGGVDVKRDPAGARRRIGYLPERAGVRPDLLAWEVLDFFAEVAGLAGAERRRRVADALERAELADRAGVLAGRLSKGQRQRLAMEAALFHDPEVLLLDEPTDGLDPDSREALLRAVRARAEAGVAVLLSSHVLGEVEGVADETAILHGGRLAEAGDGRGRWRVVLRGELERALAVARAAPGVDRVEPEPGEVPALRLALAAGAPDAAEVVARLVEAGLAVVEVRPADGLRERYRAVVDGGRSA